MRSIVPYISIFIISAFVQTPVQAQTVAEFYSKNPITLMVGAAAGG